MGAKWRPIFITSTFFVLCLLISTNKNSHFLIDTKSKPSINKYYNKTNQKSKHLTSKANELDPLHPIWAYFDPRFDRISIVVMSIYLTNNTAYCHYFDKNRKPQMPPYITKIFPDYIAHCKSDRYSPFVFLSSRKSLKGDFNTQLLKVEKIPKKPAKSGLSICLAPIFGDYHHWMLLLQFIEAHKLLGAEKFFIYFLETNDNATLSVLDYYVKKEMAQVIVLPKIGRCSQVHRCRHNFQIQDCIFRSINRYKYTAVIDIDEIITPLNHTTLTELISSVDRPEEKFGAFKFRCRWLSRNQPDPSGNALFDKNINDIMSLIDDYLPIVRFHNTTAPAPAGHTTKCIVKPETVLHMGVHFVRILIQDYTTYNFPPDQGFVRHYRNATTWEEKFRKEANAFGQIQKTEMPLNLEERIVTAVKEVVINLKNNL